MNRRFHLLILLLCCTLAITAKVRTAAQKKALAIKALNATGVTSSSEAKADEPRQTGLKELRLLDACTLIGYENGAFAVVSNDDSQPEILGVAVRPTSGSNPAFEWWLTAINEAIAGNTPQAATSILPDPKKYPQSVAPMLTTKWGQGDPFYRLCPPHPDDIFCATGCVATAMAQILKHHRLPLHGFGTHTIYYPYQDVTGTAITANFAETTYDWDNMIDLYASGTFTDEQAYAVATLMLHCAVAADMQFGGYNHGGSGTTQKKAAEGLKYYFGFEDARSIDRSDYSDEDWMDMVYNELSQGNPILYGGQNLTGGGGHAFVLNGYNEDGLVYVNWGWNGDAEGYYDIDKLNPNTYRFSQRQDMVIGISGGKTELQELTFTLNQPGLLTTLLPEDADQTCGTLKVTGRINSTDLKAIRNMAGRDAEGNSKSGYLSVLDLSEAEIIAGGEPYLSENGKQYTTTDNELPYKAFFDCRKLTEIKLPRNIRSIGDGAFGGCYVLQKVVWQEPAEKEYVRDGDVLYNQDKTQLKAVLPTAIGTFIIPSTVETINPLAFAGCVGLTKIELPATIKTIGGEAFRNCFSVTELRLHGKEQPTLGGYDTFAGIRTDLCRLYVPSGTKSRYTNRPQWRDFGENIIEYGTTFTANSLSKDYGEENPRLGYKISGVSVDGSPELSTEVTIASLPGDYPIIITAGSITDPDVEFVNGTLTVYPALLTVKAKDAARKPGEENPTFTLEFDGFVNGEDASVLQELPVVTTDATKDSSEGTYTLRVSGGKSDRYEFRYRTGTLTISNDVPSSIQEINATGRKDIIYTVDGRRVTETKQKGIYIRNGKKIVVTR